MDRQLLESIQHHMYHLNQAMRHVGENSEVLPDISWLQLQALLCLKKTDDGLMLKDLADQLGISAVSASLLVERLVNHELITRTQSTQDRRKVCLGLSESTRTKINAIKATMRGHLEQVLSSLEAEELQELDRLLAKLDISN